MRIRILLLCLLAAGLPAEHRQYRILNPDLTPIPNSPFDRSHLPLPAVERAAAYTVSYIEFNDQGKLFNREQLKLAEREVEGAKNCDSRGRCDPVAVFVYVHGWNNNASETSNDVTRFRLALAYFAEQVNQKRLYGSLRESAGKPPRILGIYIGWRGGTLKAHNAFLHPFSFLTYWSRKQGARRMTGMANPGELPSVLNSIASWVRRHDAQNRNARLYAIGHSFGGRVLEGAIHESTQHANLIGAIKAGQDAVTLPYNLVLIMNPATDSGLTRRTLTEISGAQQVGGKATKIRHPEYDARFCGNPANQDRARCRPYPAIVQIAGLRDKDTRFILPAANLANFAPPFLFLAKPSGNLRSTPFTRALRTHEVAPCAEAAPPGSIKVLLPLDGNDCRQLTAAKPGAQTPYIWSLRVGGEFITSHLDIWNLNLASLVAALIGDPVFDADTPAPPPAIGPKQQRASD